MLCRPSTSGALRLTLRPNGLPFVLSVAERSRSREAGSRPVELQSNVKRARAMRRSLPSGTARRAAVWPGVAAVTLLAPRAAQAAMDGETQFVLNSLSFLIWGGLVMWMCAGFTMLEAGSVRTKNASVICLKNIGLYSIAGLTFYLVGYNIMYSGVEEGGWFGSLELFYGTTAADRALLKS